MLYTDIDEFNSVNEGADTRKSAKNAVKAFMKAKEEFEAAYNKMSSAFNAVDSAADQMEREGDFEGNAAMENAFRYTRGNLLYSIKRAMSDYDVSKSLVDKVMQLDGKQKKWKAVPGVRLDDDDFTKVVNFVLSRLKLQGDYVSYKPGYGVSVHTSPNNASAWSKYSVSNLMYYILEAVHDLDEKSLARFNAKLSKTGLKIINVSKDYMTFTGVMRMR